MSRAIEFYKTGASYDIFSNVVGIGISCDIGDGILRSVSSTEAVFQGLKWLTTERSVDLGQFNNAIISSPGGSQQQLGGGRNKKYDEPFTGGSPNSYSNTDFSHAKAGLNAPNFSNKERLMYELIRMKATQNPEVAKALLDTGSAPIIENTKLALHDDPFWGNGQNGDGRNALGRLWEQLRHDLSKELSAIGQIQVRTGISRDLHQSLGLPSHYAGQETRGAVVTKAQLDSLPSVTTVAEISSYRTAIASSASRPISAQPASHAASSSVGQASATSSVVQSLFQDPNSAHGRALPALKTIGKITHFDISDDIGLPGKKVFKLRFDNQTDAQDFQTTANTKHNAYLGNPKGNIIIVAEDKAQKLFQSLGVELYGPSNSHRMIDALKIEANQPKTIQPQPHVTTHIQQTPSGGGPAVLSQASAVAQARASSSVGQASATSSVVQSLFQDPSAHGRALPALKTIGKITHFDISDDIGLPGKKVFKLRFDNQTDAQDFQTTANTKHNAYLGNPKGNIIIVAEDKAQKLFQFLGVGTHGIANPRNIVDALKFEANQPKTIQPQPHVTTHMQQAPSGAHPAVLSQASAVAQAMVTESAPDALKRKFPGSFWYYINQGAATQEPIVNIYYQGHEERQKDVHKITILPEAQVEVNGQYVVSYLARDINTIIAPGNIRDLILSSRKEQLSQALNQWQDSVLRTQSYQGRSM